MHGTTPWGAGDARPPEGLAVVARVPQFSTVRLALRSGDVELRGEFDHLDVHSYSGAVSARGAFRTGEVRSRHGDLSFDSVPGALSAVSDSGRITAGSVTGNARLETGAGAITVRHADPTKFLRMQSRSGPVSYTAASVAALGRITARSDTGLVNRAMARPPTAAGHDRRLRADDRPRAHPVRDGRGIWITSD